MPTENARRAGLEALRGLSAKVHSVWRRSSARARWVAVGGVVVLAALIVVVHPHLGSEPVGYEWLYGGRGFSGAEAAKIVAALRAAEIGCEERGGRISVPAGRKAEALAVLARGKLGPRAIEDLQDEAASAGSIWDGPDERQRREWRAREKWAREVIAQINGVESATVILSAIPEGTRVKPERRLRVTALVRANAGQALSQRSVEMIRNVLTSIGGVDATAVTLMDPTSGREYLVAGRPEVEAQSTARVREEELREKILDQLRIDGAIVSVRIDAPVAEPKAVERPRAERAVDWLDRPRVNQPIGEVWDDDPTRGVAVAAQPQESAAQGIAKAMVLVRVPRSHFLRLYREGHRDGTPGVEDLAPYVARVNETIRLVVGSVVGPAELGELKIDRVDDLEPALPALVSPAGGGRGGVPGWLGPVLAGLFLGLCAVIVVGRWLATRGPSGPRMRPTAPKRVSTFAESGAGPGERVRSLVRLDPAAAGGVLHRWIVQGSTER
jgi:type III secretory pathway lipoprotein EscJ